MVYGVFLCHIQKYLANQNSIFTVYIIFVINTGMRLDEIATKKFYHGSPQPLAEGKVYRVRQWKASDQGGVDKQVEDVLEKYRPKNAIPRYKAFYMTASKYKNMDEFGGVTDYVYQVEPVGRVEKHDLQWVNDLDVVLRREFLDDDTTSYSWHMPPIYASEKEETEEMLARNYWSGELYPFKPWRLIEYLTPSFRVIKLVYKEKT